VHTISGIAFESSYSTEWRAEAYRHHWSTISPYFDNTLGQISLLPQLEPDRVLVAPAEADAIGLELSARRSFGRQLSIWGNYTLSRVTDDTNGQEIVRSWDQTHSANFGIAWSGSRSSLSALLGWHSGWPQTPITMVAATTTEPASIALGARNSSRSGGFLSADLRWSTSIPVSIGELSLWLDGTNLTNRANACCRELNSFHPQAGEPEIESNLWTQRVVNAGFAFKVRLPQ
jgi:hypothetical protein